MNGPVSAFTAAYGLARFCKRARLVAVYFGVRAVVNERRASKHMFDSQHRRRVGW